MKSKKLIHHKDKLIVFFSKPEARFDFFEEGDDVTNGMVNIFKEIKKMEKDPNYPIKRATQNFFSTYVENMNNYKKEHPNERIIELKNLRRLTDISLDNIMLYLVYKYVWLGGMDLWLYVVQRNGNPDLLVRHFFYNEFREKITMHIHHVMTAIEVEKN